MKRRVRPKIVASLFIAKSQRESKCPWFRKLSRFMPIPAFALSNDCFAKVTTPRENTGFYGVKFANEW